VAEPVRDSRRVESELVAHIAEIDARKLYAREACASMFAYCTERLRLSEAEAYLRITAARVSREHPAVLAMLADRRLHLSAIARLAPVLTPANCGPVLARAIHASKRQILELVAELSPRTDVAARIRRLPRSRVVAGARATPATVQQRPLDHSEALGLGPSPSGAGGGAIDRLSCGHASCDPHHGNGEGAAPQERGAAASPVATPGSEHDDQVDLSGALLAPAASDSPLSSLTKPAASTFRQLCPDRVAVVPLAPGRYKVQFTAGAGLRDKLERLQQLMRSSVPDGDLARLIEDAVTEKIARLEARRFGETNRPRAAQEAPGSTGGKTSPAGPTGPTPGRIARRRHCRHIPAAIRRAVRRRDGDRCSFVDTEGRRCAAREHLEFHHRIPYGFGGEATVENVCLLCRTHNQYAADVDFGVGAARRVLTSENAASSASRPHRRVFRGTS
jgi:hypothetical protein